MILTISTRPNFLGGFDAVVRNADETAVTTMGSFKTKNEAYRAATILRENLRSELNANPFIGAPLLDQPPV